MKVPFFALAIRLLIASFLPTAPSLAGKNREEPAPQFIFSCDANNDLYAAWRNSSTIPVARYASAAEAVDHAPRGAGLLTDSRKKE